MSGSFLTGPSRDIDQGGKGGFSWPCGSWLEAVFSKPVRICRHEEGSMKRNLEKDAGLYWNLSRHDERVQDQSHWAGSARWPRKRWLEYGEFNFGLVRSFFQQYATSEIAEGFASKDGTGLGMRRRGQHECPVPTVPPCHRHRYFDPHPGGMRKAAGSLRLFQL